jgi:hypothetical protein
MKFIRNMKMHDTHQYKSTFKNISAISWWLFPGENILLVASHCQTLSHTVVSSTPRHEQGSNSQL